MLSEREAQSSYLGQFIPLHYHHNMLMDQRRMGGFKAAIEHVVFPGAKVLELGGGTGVMSWFAAAKAEHVWCVEFNPDLVNEARRLMALNPHGEKVEVIQADAFDYLPPEPVDVVICEMIHVAMLREKQVEMIESFKYRYLKKFGGPLPVFVPEAVVMAVQPLQQTYDFHGFYAPIVQFQEPTIFSRDTVELADPAVYSILDFTETTGLGIEWRGQFHIQEAGTVNALRFITKNILAVVADQSSTIDWLNHYLVLPLAMPVHVERDDNLLVSFQYQAGGSLASLEHALRAECVSVATQMQSQPQTRPLHHYA